MRKPGSIVAILASLVVVAGATACDGGDGGPSPTPTQGARPASTATLSIVSPKNGQVVRGEAVDVRADLEGARVVQTTSTTLRPDEGHLHVILDDSLVTMTADLETHLADLTPGRHLLQVEFVASDHAPFNPRVIAKVSFEVAE
jgi:hypothetical protein